MEKPAEEQATADDKPTGEVDDTEEAEPLLEPSPTPEPEHDELKPAKVHPLTPGGRRFEQVYAQNKQTQRELESERERRIAAEAKLEVLGSASKRVPEANDEKEYTWPELEDFIQQGRITRADAEAHREEINVRKLSSRIKADFTRETTASNRLGALSSAITEYVQASPAALDVGSPERARLDQEFDWLASVAGVDGSKLSDIQRKTLQLTALRNVYGPVESLRKRSASPKVERTEGLPGGTPPRQSANPDQAILDKLSVAQVEHYKKMFKTGRYPNKWKDVVEEIKYVPKKRY